MIRFAARAAMAAMIGIGGIVAVSEPAEARPKKRQSAAVSYNEAAAKADARRRADTEDYEAARAHAADPAGNFKDLPNWARYALSPKDHVK